MFYNCYSLTNIDGLSKWNVSNGNDFDYMFYNCSSLTDIDALSKWNVSNGICFDYMFYNCKKLKNVDGIFSWKISSVAYNELIFCLFNNNNLDIKDKLLSKFGRNCIC